MIEQRGVDDNEVDAKCKVVNKKGSTMFEKGFRCCSSIMTSKSLHER
jgi:hypothetical protein